MHNKLKLLFLGVLALGVITPSLSSCGGYDPYEEFDVPVDYVEQTKLTLNYTNRDFKTDGIGEVTLRRSIDGDTAHFYPLGQTRNEIKLRFVGIDTPESTGRVQAWGKAAAEFTRSKLENATHIVLSSQFETYGPAELDSNGRELGFVWVTDVENPTLDDFKNLNLWLIQQCYSMAKGIDETCRYHEVFLLADLQGQQMGRRIWGEEDPNFDPDEAFIKMTIQEIYDYYEDLDDPESIEGMRVEVEGTISRLTNSNSDFYIQDQFEENGEVFKRGIFVFGFYKNYGFQAGWRMLIKGRVATYMGNLQITDITYSASFPTDTDSVVLDKTGTPIEPDVVSPQEMVSEEYRSLLVQSDTTLVAYDGYGGKQSDNPSEDDAFTLELHPCTVTGFDEEGDALYESDTTVSIQMRIQSYVAFRDEYGLRVRDYAWFLNRPFDLIGVGSLYVNEYTQRETPQVLLLIVEDMMWITQDA